MILDQKAKILYDNTLNINIDNILEDNIISYM